MATPIASTSAAAAAAAPAEPNYLFLVGHCYNRDTQTQTTHFRIFDQTDAVFHKFDELEQKTELHDFFNFVLTYVGSKIYKMYKLHANDSMAKLELLDLTTLEKSVLTTEVDKRICCGAIMNDNVIYGTKDHEIFSIDLTTLKWEKKKPTFFRKTYCSIDSVDAFVAVKEINKVFGFAPGICEIYEADTDNVCRLSKYANHKENFLAAHVNGKVFLCNVYNENENEKFKFFILTVSTLDWNTITPRIKTEVKPRRMTVHEGGVAICSDDLTIHHFMMTENGLTHKYLGSGQGNEEMDCFDIYSVPREDLKKYIKIE